MKVSPISPMNIPHAHHPWVGILDHGKKKRQKVQPSAIKCCIQQDTSGGSLLLYDRAGICVNYPSSARIIGEV